MGWAGIWAGLNRWAVLNMGTEKLLRQVLDSLQVKSVEKLEGEDELLQLHLVVGPFEDATPTGHSQVSVFIGQVLPLHR